jgi:hypothetical protein
VSQQGALLKGYLPEAQFEDMLEDTFRVMSVGLEDTLVIADLDIEALKEFTAFASLRPFGLVKAAVLNLTGCSSRVQASLAHMLEYPPSYLRVMLFSESKTIPLLESRCHILRLPREQSHTQEARVKALKALASASLGDKKSLRDVLSEWSTEDTEAVRAWAVDSITQRYLVFSKTEIDGLGFTQGFAESLLEGLETLRLADSRRAMGSLLMAQIANQKG